MYILFAPLSTDDNCVNHRFVVAVSKCCAMNCISVQVKSCNKCDVEGDELLKPIIQFAGKDISHWFNAKTNNVRYAVVLQLTISD